MKNNIRIQKALAQIGIASRRAIEKMIENKEILVNNQVAEIGQKINYKDKIIINNKNIDLSSLNNINKSEQHEVLLYNKPEGEICSKSDPKHENTVFRNLPKPKIGRWIQVGRLDLNTSGLLLFTTDGELANKLMHPRQQIERVYLTRVFGEINDNKINKLLKGVKLEDGLAKFKDIKLNNNQNNDKYNNKWLECTLTEGRNREVRRLWASQDCTVSRLMRIRFGNIVMPKNLKSGSFILLDKNSVSGLYQDAGLKSA